MGISKSDLRGDIAGFPIEVVELMLIRQQEQGNPRDVNVFINDREAARKEGGFSWDETPEWNEYIDTSFWAKVVRRRMFDVFYALYPSRGCLNAKSWD